MNPLSTDLTKQLWANSRAKGRSSARSRNGKMALLTALALAALSSNGFGQTTYTWTGTGGDGLWATPGNWDGNGVPVDDNPGGAGVSLPVGDKMVFSGSTMPTDAPNVGSQYSGDDQDGRWSIPTMEFNSGGAISFGFNSSHNSGMFTNFGSGTDRQVWTVGDGVSGAGEDVVVTMSSNIHLMRHGDGTHRFTVNADGTLNFSGWVDFVYNALRYATITIDGGAVNVSGEVRDLGAFGSYVDFTATGGSFSAAYGGSFASATDVINALGIAFLNNSGGELQVVDHDGASFTVSAIVPPDPNYWTGIGGATWDAATTENFTLNAEAAPLDNTTFALATAASGRATFADAYYDSGNPVTVTQTSVSIAAGGVSTDEVFFTNSGSYDISAADTTGITGATEVAVSGGGTVTLLDPNTHTGTTNVSGGSTLVLADSMALQNSILSGASPVVFDESVVSNVFTLGGLGSNAAFPLENNAASPAPIELIVGGNDEDSTAGALLSGAGSLTKVGFGMLTLSDAGGASTYTGDTVIKSGTLAAGPGNGNIGLSQGGSVVYLGDSTGAEDATLQFDVASTTTYPATINYVVQSGSTGLRIITSNGRTTVAGTVTLGSAGTGQDLIMESVTGNAGWWVRFTGAIQDPAGLTGTPGNITIDAGAQPIDLRGPNTYSGDTIVNDTFIVSNGGSVSFYPTSSPVGTTNQIRGDFGGGSVTIDGGFNIDLTNATAAVGNTWMLVDPTDLSSVIYGDNFHVESSSGGFVETNPGSGIWVLADGLYQWVYTESSHTLGYQQVDNYKLWTGNLGGTWDQATTKNFAINNPLTPIYEEDFATATASSMAAQFADSYWNSGSPVPVTTANVNIDGGVQTGLIDFINQATPYTVAAPTSVGITAATEVQVRGGGTVTLVNEHDYTGATTITAGSTLNIGDGTTDGSITESAIATDGALVFNNVGVVEQTGAVSGTGTLEKAGAGTLTLGSANTYTGATTVTAGTLTFWDLNTSPSYAISSGAVLDFDFVTDLAVAANPVFNGTGTLRKSGFGTISWTNTSATFALGSGALIDVQGGIIVGGSNANEVWIGNLSDLNVAAGAIFRGVEANVEVDVLTGDGTISSGYPGAGYVAFTMGVDNGSGTFDGDLANTVSPGSFTKVGTGTQTLTGLSTYTGNTTIEAGAITLAEGGELTLVPAANGINNVITGVADGSGTINLDGALYLDLLTTDTTDENSWLLVDETDLTVAYGETFGVNSSLGMFADADGVWTLDAAGNLWTFTESTGTLTVGAGTSVGYDAWLALYPDLSDTSPLGDPDLDGIENTLEYVLNGNPEVADLSVLPVLDTSGADFVFSFTRREESANDTTQVFQYGSNLTDWIDLNITDPTDMEVTLGTPVDGLQTVTVTISKSLAIDGKLFGRLNATLIP